MFATVADLLLHYGAVSAGTVSLARLRPFMTEAGVFETARFHSVLTAVFPYYAGDEGGNLSLYCRGLDYHRVLGLRLKAAAELLHKETGGLEFLPHIDGSLFPEVIAARLSGAAMMGLHGLAIAPPFGSYVFIGCILSALPLPDDEDAGACDGCGACARACPTGALSTEGSFFFRRSRCLSHLTQERRPPEDAETLLSHSKLVFGCDLCQKACPHNRNPAKTETPEFSGENLLPSLDFQEISALSERAFRRKYGDRAFSFRGLAPILRNFRYQTK